MKDQRQSRWRKSSYSGGNGGGCVEIAESMGLVMVRDSQLAERSPVLGPFTVADWRTFLASLR